MPLEMNREVFVTCAVTGSGATQDRNPHVPRSPAEIARAAVAIGERPGARVIGPDVVRARLGLVKRAPKAVA